MKFDFPVKHNGIIYPVGSIVPIGKELKKENKLNDKTATEIRKELKEVYGITKFPSNKKEDLVKQLDEAEKAKKLEDEAKAKEIELNDDESNKEEGNEGSDIDPEDESSLLDKIIQK